MDHVGGKQRHQPAGARGDAALGQQFTQAIDGAADAFLGGFFARAECSRHLTRRFALEVAQQQCVAIRVAQLTQGGIEVRGNLLPGRLGPGFGGKQIIHGGGFLFAGAAAHI